MFQRSGSCLSQCYNGCCRSQSFCQNGGTCFELCDNVTRKFECSCMPGYVGRVCETPVSCVAHSFDMLPSPLFSLFIAKYDRINVYCDTTSDPGMVWTLIESFSRLYRAKYRNMPFSVDFPVNVMKFNWTDYRLSLAAMRHIRNQSTHWRATCNFDQDGLIMNDYVRGRLIDIDVITYLGGHACFPVEYVNVRGHNCSDCTTHIRQDDKFHIFIDSYQGSAYKCSINFLENSIKVLNDYCDNFGKYKIVNPEHRCVSSSSSTTQWWLGIANDED